VAARPPDASAAADSFCLCWQLASLSFLSATDAILAWEFYAMIPSRNQQTLARPAVVTGRGYWTGDDVTVEFRPAAADSGIAFVRDDLSPAVRIAVSTENQQPAARRTILSSGNAKVEMIEHVLAALLGLGVDNCEVGVTASEMPGCDGSSLDFVRAIVDAGLVEQASPIEPLVVKQPVRCTTDDPNVWIEARPPIGEGLSVEYSLDYGDDSAIGAQWIVVDLSPSSFLTELAPARTFLLEAEAEAIKSQGLGKHVTPQDLLIYGPQGPLENQLRYPDECVRHKSLDVVGDLGLAGRPIIGHVVACRSGHKLNAELVRKLIDTHAQPARRRSA